MTVLFTTSWDDGVVDDLRLLKIMNKYGIKGTFYIPGNTSLSTRQIQRIARSQEVGAHTMNHVVLDKVDLKTAEVEVKKSKEWLEGIIKKKVDSFCYPRGKYNKKVVRLVNEAGFTYARTTERMTFEITNPFLVGTSCQTIIFKVDAIRILQVTKRVSSLRYITSPLVLWKEMFNEAKKREGIFHLWGHSWEISRYNQWEDLEKFFKWVSGEKGVKYLTNSQCV